MTSNGHCAIYIKNLKISFSPEQVKLGIYYWVPKYYQDYLNDDFSQVFFLVLCVKTTRLMYIIEDLA